MEQMVDLKRGDIFVARLQKPVGNEQGGTRPVVIIQNNMGNKKSGTVIIAPLTTKRSNENYPFHVKLRKEFSGLEQDSVVLCEQIRVIDKKRLGTYISSLTPKDIIKINEALKLELNI